MTGLMILAVSLALGAGPSEQEILDQADARIARYRTGEAVVQLTGPDGRPLPAGTPVKIEQTNHSFLFGSNIFVLGRLASPADDAAYEKYYAELLNYATLPFYWWAYERRQGEPDHKRTQEIARWCRSHHVLMKGHPLAWNWVDPPWLPDDPEAVMRLQFDRIASCVKHFEQDVTIWDVVNEATHYDRPEPQREAPKLTGAITRMGVGEYVQQAFRSARRANPQATLVINDYRTDPAYAEKVISVLVDEQGKPLYDVIGIQSHQHGGAWPVTTIWEVCERFATFGKPLHFTETTFLSGEMGYELTKRKNDPNFRWPSTPEGEQRQARDVARFYTVLFSHPAVEAITWWDFTDQKAWQQAPAGLLRADMTPKPAYEELKRLIKGRWWTRTDAAVTAGGQARFRGTFGQYQVTVEQAAVRLTGTFSFDRRTTGPIQVRLK